ncbi:MAG: ISNCY family transposase, partial [Eubacteriales bacterium]|nr:ISNCY family transposase [Eubacteriales bacterium]
PNNPELEMRPEGSKSHLASGLPTFKFVCPKMKWFYDKSTKKSHRQHFCDNPCTSSKCGRMVYIYPEKDLRAYPGTIRGTEEWDNTYKIRTAVERDINHIKENLCLAGRRTRDEKTLHADHVFSQSFLA